MNRRKYHEESTNVSIVSVSLLAQQSGLGERGGNDKGPSQPIA